ncbi:MAG TPA: PQQ-dependent sugar dehydrogenase [Thermoanaerobaculia bacterium]|nr:PQQ-dependent sugar dehydrogenase [Thermoanaerobaculia bacterium]
MKAVIFAGSILFAAALGATTLPGFRTEKIATTNGFCTSVAVDSQGTIYYTVQGGTLFRLDTFGGSTTVATVNTNGTSNSGLLGMALLDDTHAVVHYTTPNQTYDVLGRIDLMTGAESVVQQFVCDIEVPERGSSPEHHGGTPDVGADGSIVVGIGDYGTGAPAALPQWNGGKIFRVTPQGETIQFARGMRNPYGVLWDAARQRVIVADNGANIGDALFVLNQGANCGWPFSFGGQPPVDGIAKPVYFFPQTIAPTGMLALNGANAQLRSGILIGAFVTKAVYFFPDVDANPVPPPIALLDHEIGPVIGIAQSARGDIVVASGSAIYRLSMPLRGDCNGDGVLNSQDVDAIVRELADAPERTYDAQGGSYAGSWGCDANGDGTIDANDLVELIRIIHPRRRSVRSVH